MDQGYEKSKPVHKLRAHTLELVIWQNDGKALSSRGASQEATNETT